MTASPMTFRDAEAGREANGPVRVLSSMEGPACRGWGRGGSGAVEGLRLLRWAIPTAGSESRKNRTEESA